MGRKAMMTPNNEIEGGEYSIEEKVDSLVATAMDVKRKLRLRNITMAVVGTVFAAMLVFCAVVIQGLSGQADDLESIARDNKINGDIVRENSDAIIAATGPEAQRRSAAGTVDILRRNAVETDCRSRRQQVRLPAPDAGSSCESQTDPSVYPGVEGQPSR